MKRNDVDRQRSVVKISTVTKAPNPFQPWDLRYQEHSGGSGCIIAGHRILTNAHVVRHDVFVQVSRPGDSKRYTASVEHIDHTAELALLTADPALFEGSEPVAFGHVPSRQDRIEVYGFPQGGDELAVTSGVVSRVEVRRYTHSARRLLALQTDAALHPGSSGGPVFSGNQMVGLAFQGKADKIGYIVPVPIIEAFLRSADATNMRGVPDLGVLWQKIESPALRRWLHLGESDAGVLVSRVLFRSSAWNALRDGDVLTAIDGTTIHNDGTIDIHGQRIEFSYLVSTKQTGSQCRLSFVRDGQTREQVVCLLPIVAMVPPPEYRRRPTYLVFAGLVFMPLTHEYLRFLDWETVSARFRYFFYGGELPSASRTEVVFMNQVLAHEVNVGYHAVKGAIVERVNGHPITSMKSLSTALATPQDGFHVIEIDHSGIPGEYTEFSGTKLVLDATLVESATTDILRRYDIPRDRSDDLIADSADPQHMDIRRDRIA